MEFFFVSIFWLAIFIGAFAISPWVGIGLCTYFGFLFVVR